MNILKNTSTPQVDLYARAYRLFGFEHRFAALKTGIRTYRFFQVELGKDTLTFKPIKNIEYLGNMEYLKNNLNLEKILRIIENIKTKTFKLNQQKEILSYLHLDWILVLDTFYSDSETNKHLAEYLQLETNNYELGAQLWNLKGHSEQRSNIYTTNLNSTILSKINPLHNQHAANLSDENVSLIRTNKLMAFIEIDSGYDNSKLSSFLTKAKKWCNLIYKKEHVSDDKCFNLKIRKIKRTRKKGMFIANQNTIIIDPRHTDSFIHELGHWYHTHFLPEMTDESEAERFAEGFENYLSSFKRT